MINANGRVCKALLYASVTLATMVARPARVYAQTTTLTSCTDITQPGVYLLGASLAAPSGQPCMQVHSQGPVTLDCQGYNIESALPALEALLIQNSNNFTIQNCNIRPSAEFGSANEVQIQNSSNGTLQNNTFLGSPVVTDVNEVVVVSSDSITFANNTFDVPYLQTYTTNSRIRNNSFSLGLTFYRAVLESDGGSGNIISNNTMDGRLDGSNVAFDRRG
jgi:hypothetical protein